MQVIAPTLWFATEAAEAAAFYVGIFPASRIVRTTVWPPGGPGEEGSTLVVDFELAGQPMIALNVGTPKPFTEAISLSVMCDTQAEVDRYWDALLDGGRPSVCGWLYDRYGLSWQIVPTAIRAMLHDPDRERAARAMRAMMGMVKLDVAGLQRAFDG